MALVVNASKKKIPIINVINVLPEKKLSVFTRGQENTSKIGWIGIKWSVLFLFKSLHSVSRRIPGR